MAVAVDAAEAQKFKLAQAVAHHGPRPPRAMRKSKLGPLWDQRAQGMHSRQLTRQVQAAA